MTSLNSIQAHSASSYLGGRSKRRGVSGRGHRAVSGSGGTAREAEGHEGGRQDLGPHLRVSLPSASSTCAKGQQRAGLLRAAGWSATLQEHMTGRLEAGTARHSAADAARFLDASSKSRCALWRAAGLQRQLQRPSLRNLCSTHNALTPAPCALTMTNRGQSRSLQKPGLTHSAAAPAAHRASRPRNRAVPFMVPKVCKVGCEEKAASKGERGGESMRGADGAPH